MRKFSIIVSCVTCLLISCSDGKPDISDISISMEIQRLDRDIFNLAPDSLHERYGMFFDYYTEGILDIGNYRDSSFLEYLEMFKNDSAVKIARIDVEKQFPDLKELRNKLITAFKYYRYYFPDKHIPEVCTYISGFNQSLILTDSVLGIGLDKYLGANYDFYRQLQFHRYIVRNMYPEKIVSDCIEAWTGSEWKLNTGKNNDLISKMLYEGKIFYAAKKILPDEADTVIFGFTAEQIRWCENNEQTMWITLVENKLLFSTTPFTVKKFTDLAPYTPDFTSESPGRACNWIGYNIITKYMKNSPQTTLRELMDNDDYHKILEQAKYKP